MATPAETLIGRTIAGKFAIEAFLGGGAMGTVFRARQIALEKTVAIKVLHRELTREPMFAMRFLREAKAASRIDHANSMRVLDFGEEPDGLLYMAMEYLDGRDLFTIIQQEYPLPNERIIGLLMQTLAALAVAHDMGVVHRDLKPENIMVLAGRDDEGQSRDVVKVCDFGIAKLTERRSELTESEGPKLTTQGLVVGTPEYMSPEQGRGEPLDARSDLYSVGVVLFQLLCGRVPFDAESALGIVLKHVTDEPPRPSEIVPDVDPRLEAMCLKALRKRREERYQSAREMRADLRGMLSGAEASSHFSQQLPPVSQSQSYLRSNVSNMGSAATAVAIDSSAVRAGSGPNRAVPTASKVTPIGTETSSLELSQSARWPGYLIAAALLTGAVGTLVYKLRPSPRGDVALASTVLAPSASASASAPEPVASLAPLFPSAKPRPRDPKDKSKTAPGSTPSASASASGVRLAPLPDGGPNGGSTAPGASATATASGATVGAPPAAAYDPANAKVTGAGMRALKNTTRLDVFAQLHWHTFAECYRGALQGVTAKPAVAHVTMHLDTDDAGKVNNGTFLGDVVPKAAVSCIGASMVGKVLRTLDATGPASADVELVFSPE